MKKAQIKELILFGSVVKEVIVIGIVFSDDKINEKVLQKKKKKKDVVNTVNVC